MGNIKLAGASLIFKSIYRLSISLQLCLERWNISHNDPVKNKAIHGIIGIIISKQDNTYLF